MCVDAETGSAGAGKNERLVFTAACFAHDMGCISYVQYNMYDDLCCIL